jgi:hypothetical protein
VPALALREAEGAAKRLRPELGRLRPVRRQHQLVPAAALAEVAAHVPEAAQRPGDAELELRFTRLVSPGERRPQVVVLGLDALDPVGLLGAAQDAHLGLLGEVGEVLGVAALEVLGLTTLVQALERVGADGFEHAEAVARVADEAVLGERLEREDVDVADGVRSGEREAAGEDAQAGERFLTARFEQPVAPVHGGPERAVALGEVARPSREEREPVGQALEQLLGRERAHTRRRQLDREREPVQRGAELRHRPIRSELRPDRGRALGEQRDGSLAGEPAERKLALAPEPERDPARRQDLQARCRGEQPRDERRRAEHLLEVVEDEEHGATNQEALERRLERARALLHSDRVRDRGQREGGLGDGRELDEDDAVGEVECRPAGHLERKPGLARAARAGDRHAADLL